MSDEEQQKGQLPRLFVVPSADGRVWLMIQRTEADAAGNCHWTMLGILPEVALSTVQQIIQAISVVRGGAGVDLEELLKADPLPLEGVMKEQVH